MLLSQLGHDMNNPSTLLRAGPHNNHHVQANAMSVQVGSWFAAMDKVYHYRFINQGCGCHGRIDPGSTRSTDYWHLTKTAGLDISPVVKVPALGFIGNRLNRIGAGTQLTKITTCGLFDYRSTGYHFSSYTTEIIRICSPFGFSAQRKHACTGIINMLLVFTRQPARRNEP